METISLEVTEEHLDRSIRARTRPDYCGDNISEICLMAQATKDRGYFISGMGDAVVRRIGSKEMYLICPEATPFAVAWGHEEYDSIRVQLPRTFVFVSI